VDEATVHQRLISVGGDPFVYAAPALAEMTPSQRDKVLREHHAVEYREHLRRIVAAGVFDEEEEEE
jgi:hypothetical protein